MDKSIKTSIKVYLRHPLSLAVRLLVAAAAMLTVITFLVLVGYILINGLPHLKLSLFAMQYNSVNVSMLPAIVNTIGMVVLALVFSVPFGVGAAVYLVEYAPKESQLVTLIRFTAETLTGIPSILYGLFGMLFFVITLGWGYCMLAGAMTLAIMVLPTILRTTEEALLCVPQAYREGSYGLGAGKLATIFKLVLPSAVPGIFSGVILSIGRIVGETAALIYTAGTMTGFAGVMDSGRTLAIHMYVLSNEGLHKNEANAAAVVLLLLVFLMNTLSSYAAKRWNHQKNEKTDSLPEQVGKKEKREEPVWQKSLKYHI